MHLSDEQIQRYLHGELDAPARDAVLRHRAECRECAHALDMAAREEESIFGLLREVDHPAPAVEAGTLVTTRRGVPVWGRRVAAAVVVVALAGVAYAIPGSPVRALVKRVAQVITGQSKAPQPGDTVLSTEPVTAGISVPAQERFSILFTNEQAGGTAVVTFTDGDMVTVRARGGSARFTTDEGRLIIDNADSTADYEIEVPGGVQYLEIDAGDRKLFLKDRDVQVMGFGKRDEEGHLVFPLSPPFSER